MNHFYILAGIFTFLAMWSAEEELARAASTGYAVSAGLCILAAAIYSSSVKEFRDDRA